MSFGWPGSGLCLLPLVAGGLFAAMLVIAISSSPGPVPQPSVPVVGADGFTRSPDPLGTALGLTTSAPPSGVSISRCPWVLSAGLWEAPEDLGKMLLPASFSMYLWSRRSRAEWGRFESSCCNRWCFDRATRDGSGAHFFFFFCCSRLAFAQPSLLTWRPRATARASGGTFSVTQDAAPI